MAQLYDTLSFIFRYWFLFLAAMMLLLLVLNSRAEYRERKAVMGEVGRPGSFTISGDRITLLEALSMAGDLTIYGRRDRVAVIRENDGKRTILFHDLRSADIFNSPCYYLQQNDIVYVEPNKAKSGQSSINQNNSIGVWVSVISLLTTIAVLIFK